MAEVEAQTTTPAHIDHIMKSGFTMSDIKGMSRSYGEDAAEADEQMLRPANPPRPPRKGSLTRTGYEPDDPQMQRSTSALDMGDYQTAEEIEEDRADEKKRGRSPFRFFKKSRDQSKDKLKSRSPDAKDRQKMRKCARVTGGRTAVYLQMCVSMSARSSRPKRRSVADGHANTDGARLGRKWIHLSVALRFSPSNNSSPSARRPI